MAIKQHRIAIDLHGVADDYKPQMKEYMMSMREKRNMYFIIVSGATAVRVKDELDYMEYIEGVHYDEIVSIHDFCKSEGMPSVKVNRNGELMTLDNDWRYVKGKICEVYDIDTLVDDKEYHITGIKYFSPKTRFILVDDFLKETGLNRTLTPLHKISFDFHGVLDTYTKKLQEYMKVLRVLGGTQISVLSGARTKYLQTNLDRLGFKQGVHYDEILSILDHCDENNIELTVIDGQEFTVFENDWWECKGVLCDKHKIKIHIDDDIKYKETIEENSENTQFILIEELLNDIKTGD